MALKLRRKWTGRFRGQLSYTRKILIRLLNYNEKHPILFVFTIEQQQQLTEVIGLMESKLLEQTLR